ncbi:polysaccharide deacetylase family protein [Clostridium akagii]|uniref:polysaccharide deacetylase family protein n=1 Tax=Clostridium akagii TaxID=91623 RepID=UPI00047C89C1|nr:polysaccharide deacetylase family protein [Clostridium akagii]
MKEKKRLLICIFSTIMLISALNITADATISKPLKGLNTYIEDANHGNKVIYLTFDDGPSDPITGKVLDILKENNVKATFFVIGNQIPGLEDVLQRTHKEGHSIGLHTYTHKFKRIYSSSDNLVKEMNLCQAEINNVVGVSPNIIRFPGGSKKHLNYNLLNRLHSSNFKIYDWNMETLDGINPKLSPYKIYKDATNNSENLSTIVLLLHCDYMHKNTCLALPKIIKYYKDHGYKFQPITNDTPELYFPIKKSN